MHNHLRSSWTWCPPLLALLLMGVIYFTGSNQSVFLALNRTGHVLDDGWWARLTILGDGGVAFALLLLGIRKSPQRFWAALSAAVIVVMWVHICKYAMPLPRPLAVISAQEFFQIGPRLRAGSFPSGHSATIFALVGIWIIGRPRHYLLRLILLFLATLVAASRIMVGVHWPLDVLAGMAIGWVSAFAGLWLCRHLQWKTSSIGGLVAGCALLAIAATLLFSRHTGFETALDLQRLLGLTCFVWGAREMYFLFPAMRHQFRFEGKRIGKEERIT